MVISDMLQVMHKVGTMPAEAQCHLQLVYCLNGNICSVCSASSNSLLTHRAGEAGMLYEEFKTK